MKRLSDIVERLLEKAWRHRVIGLGVSKQRPGALIEELSSEEREVLKTATAKDFDHNPPTVKKYKPF